MAPFNGAAPEMAALAKFFRQEGLFTIVRWNYFFTNPPLIITEDQLREAFGIIDRGLEITDKAVGVAPRMNCYTHASSPAVGICAICQKAVMPCVRRPRCATAGVSQTASSAARVLYGFEYKSSAMLGTWPLVHICAAIDPADDAAKSGDGRSSRSATSPCGGHRARRLAVGVDGTSAACRLDIACALGGAALGVGLSVGRIRVRVDRGRGPCNWAEVRDWRSRVRASVIDGRICDEAARDLWMRWLGTRSLPPRCTLNPFKLIQ